MQFVLWQIVAVSAHSGEKVLNPVSSQFVKRYLKVCSLMDEDFEESRAKRLIGQIVGAAKQRLDQEQDVEYVPGLVAAVVDTLECEVLEVAPCLDNVSVLHAGKTDKLGGCNLMLIALVAARELDLPVRVAESRLGQILVESRHPPIGYFVIADQGVPRLLRFSIPTPQQDHWSIQYIADDAWLATILAHGIEPSHEQATSQRLALAKKLAPACPEVPAAAATLLHLSGRQLQKAKALYREALDKGSREPAVCRNLASLELAEGGDIDEVLKCLALAKKMGDQSASYHQLLAQALVKAGQPAKAASALEEGLKHNPDDPHLQEMLARYCLGTEEYDRAWQLTKGALRRNVYDPDLYQFATVILRRRKHPPQKDLVLIFEWIKVALEARPRCPGLWRALAVTQALIGDHESARLSLRNAVIAHGDAKPRWYEKDLAELRAIKAEAAKRSQQPARDKPP